MKLGELFINLAVKGDTKKLDKAIKQLDESVKRTKMLIQYRRDLAKATTEEERSLIKRNFADKVRLENLNKQKAAMQANISALGGMVTAAGAFATAFITAVAVLDRMATSLSKVNQGMINFQRQTGLSFASLNKYSSASSAVNFNATEEGMANTMQRLSNNLREIKLGRGDISPYQELAYMGGKPINVWGKSVEQVIEEVREAIKGVDDVSATNIITRMGFNPEDLLMLRMTKQQFDEISNSYFLSPQQREDLYKYSLELKKIHLQIQYIYQSTVLFLMKKILPEIKPIFDGINHIGQALGKVHDIIEKLVNSSDVFSKIKNGISGVGEAIKMVLNPFLMLFYLLEDIAVYFLGGKSLLGLAVDGIKEWVESIAPLFDRLNNPNLSNLIELLSSLRGVLMPFWGNNISEDTAPRVSYGGNTTTTNNAEVNNNVQVYTSRPVSEVLNDTTNLSFTQVQLLPTK